MMKKRELPDVGTVLVAKYRGNQYEAKVVKDKNTDGGKAIEYGDKLYPSMTAAATAITINNVNGWRFWKF